MLHAFKRSQCSFIIFFGVCAFVCVCALGWVIHMQAVLGALLYHIYLYLFR